jgi:two-component system, OmpR family, alkaline phosphatase synthesis response regulator PhoP
MAWPLRLLRAMLTILIADDEPNIVELVRVTLEDDRVRVFQAYDARSALALVDIVHPDLLLLDVNFPDGSGLDVCRSVRRHPEGAAVKIVMLTAAAQQEDIARGLEAGADHYLTKPFSPVALLTLVEKLLPEASGWLSR